MLPDLFKKFVYFTLCTVVLAVLVACGGAAEPTSTPVVSQPALPLLNEAIDTVTELAAANGWSPFDSVPSPDAQTIYFTANGSSGPAVYRVAAGGGEITAVTSGSPLAAPWGLTISTDGQTLYVADMGVQDVADGNVIFSIPASGGRPTPLTPTAGSRPNVPDLVNENGVDMLYYSGLDPADQQPAIFKLNPSEDESVMTVFKGAPLVQPSGVAVAKDGTVYVVDIEASEGQQAAVFRIQNGVATKLADQFRTDRWIAGAALTLDESILLISSLDTIKGTAQVLAVILSTGELGLINKGIAENTGAGGVHRAHNLNQFSWADLPGPTSRVRPPILGGFSDGGGVYLLTTP